jgi:isoleucyl-tRNA synthetase
MKADLAQREPKQLQRWAEQGIYQRIREVSPRSTAVSLS